MRGTLGTSTTCPDRAAACSGTWRGGSQPLRRRSCVAWHPPRALPPSPLATRYLPGLGDDELITGVMVPWLYVGSALSAFCWHVEDHALNSVNYHHMGAAKVGGWARVGVHGSTRCLSSTVNWHTPSPPRVQVWYGVPAHASEALEEAMRDALPHLFKASPSLLYQLVTHMSPRELQV